MINIEQRPSITSSHPVNQRPASSHQCHLSPSSTQLEPSSFCAHCLFQPIITLPNILSFSRLYFAFNPKLSFFSLIIFTLHQPTYFTLPNTSESVCHQTACPMGSKFAILLDVNIPSAVSSLSLTNHHLKSRRKGKPDTHSLHVSEKSIHSFLNNSLILQP